MKVAFPVACGRRDRTVLVEQIAGGELFRRQGLFYINIGKVGEGSALLERSLHVSRSQQARIWELRTANDLARLWVDQGRRADAYELLAPMYGGFTQGFDSVDLKEARVLLDELT